MRVPAALWILPFLLLGSGPSAAAPDAPPPRPVRLDPGRPVRMLLGGKTRPAWLPFRVDVPAGTARLLLRARAGGSDVDLLVRRGEEIQRGADDAEWMGLSFSAEEDLGVGGRGPLQAGTYFGRAVLFDPATEVEVVLEATLTPPGEAPPTWGDEDPPLLPFDTWVAGTVRPRESAITWHALDLPAGTTSVHALILGASDPLDLVLVRPSDGMVVGRSLGPRVDERIDHTLAQPFARPATLYLGVLSRDSDGEEVSYRIAAAPDRAPTLPTDLEWPPVLTGPNLSPVERVGAATVELTTDSQGGGSGSCVSPRGLVLTCRHVLTDSDDDAAPLQKEGVLVAFPRSIDQPPVQSYEARLVLEDKTLDLALLRIERDVFGRPLPDDLALPWIPLGDASGAGLGEPVVALGYPECGSCRTRTPLVVSKGIVAGFEAARAPLRWLKTDAWIASGYSGGAVVDKEWRLVGIPAATLGETESLGLVIPVDTLPAGWREEIAKDLSSKELGPR